MASREWSVIGYVDIEEQVDADSTPARPRTLMHRIMDHLLRLTSSKRLVTSMRPGRRAALTTKGFLGGESYRWKGIA